MVYRVCFHLRKLPCEVYELTFKELLLLNKAITKYEAIELDIRMRLAGSTEGYSELSEILNEEKAEEVKVNTDERTLGNKQMLAQMQQIRGN